MTTSVRDHTAGVLTALVGTGKPVGDTEAPLDGGWQNDMGVDSFIPYVVLELSGPVDYSGPLGDTEGMSKINYRVTSVGATREQCEWMADRVRVTLNKANVTVNNRSVMGVTAAAHGFPRREESVEPPFYFIADSYSVWTTRS